MLYHVKGSILFQMPTHYFEVLQYGVHTQNLENIVFLFPNEIRFNGLMERYEICDILLFLNQFSSISDTSVLASRRDNDICLFELHEGLIHEFPYLYRTDKKRMQPIHYLIEALRKKSFTIHVNYEQFSMKEKDEFEQAIITIKNNLKENIETELAVLSALVKSKEFIEVSTGVEKIRWDRTNDKEVSVLPFILSNTPQTIDCKYPFLSTYQYDEKETRVFQWRHITFPLHTLFLSRSDKKTIKLLNGEHVTPCSQCEFRLRSITGGCQPCRPKLKKR